MLGLGSDRDAELGFRDLSHCEVLTVSPDLLSDLLYVIRLCTVFCDGINCLFSCLLFWYRVLFFVVVILG